MISFVISYLMARRTYVCHHHMSLLVTSDASIDFNFIVASMVLFWPISFSILSKRIQKNQLSLAGTNSLYGIRTRVTAVKRRCLNPLTNGP